MDNSRKKCSYVRIFFLTYEYKKKVNNNAEKKIYICKSLMSTYSLHITRERYKDTKSFIKSFYSFIQYSKQQFCQLSDKEIWFNPVLR